MKHRIDRSRIAGRLAAGLLMSTCLTPSALWAADFTVTNNADSGAGSLRQAIINSNSAGGSNNIIINSGVGTITLTSADLPPIGNNATAATAAPRPGAAVVSVWAPRAAIMAARAKPESPPAEALVALPAIPARQVPAPMAEAVAATTQAAAAQLVAAASVAALAAT